MKEKDPPYFEWEALRDPIKVSKVCSIKELPEGLTKIVIKRDENYKLHGRLYAQGDFKSFWRERNNIIPGSFVEPFDIRGSDQIESKHYALDSCTLGAITFSQYGQEDSCEADLRIREFRVKYKPEADYMCLAEWYINGPDDYSVLGDSSKIINACGFQFLVTKIPKGIGPTWSSNIRIVYRKDWGRIPDHEEREKISELCSFILGRQLLLVGYTVFDKEGNIIEEYACDPWSSDPKSLCSNQYDLPPIRIGYHNSQGKAEEYIGQLLPAYFELRNSLNLNEALWLYWISRNTPVGMDLTILWAAVETLINGWFNYEKTKSPVYISKLKFENLLREELEVIKSKLKDEKYGKEIIHKILNAYEMSITDRFRFFFEEIKLPIDKHEWDAIKARHVVAHGKIEFDKIEWKLFVTYKRTYETLIHRILLKLLGYSGSYIDRSVLGWKDKQLV